MSKEIGGMKVSMDDSTEGSITRHFKDWMEKINDSKELDDTITLRVSPAWDCKYSILDVIERARRCMIHRRYHERGSGVSTGYGDAPTEGNKVISVKITDDEDDLWMLLGVSDEGWVYVADTRPDTENPDWVPVGIMEGVLEVNRLMTN